MICDVVVLSCTTLARAQGVPVCLEGLLTDVRDRSERGNSVFLGSLEIENLWRERGGGLDRRRDFPQDRIERRFSLSFYYFFSPLAVIPHTYVICHRPRITCVARLDWRVNFASCVEHSFERR